jgi:hypothetical protein
MIDFIARLPTTNFRILVGILLAVAYVAILLIGAMMGKLIDESTRHNVGIFIGVMLGIDFGQFIAKRTTFDSAALGQTRESIDPSPAQPAAAQRAVITRAITVDASAEATPARDAMRRAAGSADTFVRRAEPRDFYEVALSPERGAD